MYCPDTDAVYLVPITDVPDRGACLRAKPIKNNQAKGVRWAKDGVRWAKDGVRWAKDGVRWAKDGVRWAKDYVLGHRVKVPAAAG